MMMSGADAAHDSQSADFMHSDKYATLLSRQVNDKRVLWVFKKHTNTNVDPVV